MSLNSNEIYQDRYSKTVTVAPIPIDELERDIGNNRELELSRVLDDVRDIKEISLNMSHMLIEQGENLDTVENNLDKADNSMKKADKEIDKASKYKKDGRVRLVGGTTGAIAGSFFGPIGSLIGAGIGVVGTSIYILAK